jgi:Polyketide cyclase / dehydrase and lipid transport
MTAVHPATTDPHRQTGRMSTHTHSESIVIARSPEDLYDLVSDVPRMGEWSPICKACWWDEGASPVVGSWFTGRNETPDRTWETRSEVVVADRGREFAFIVGGAFVRWGYSFTPVDGGTELTESWEFLPGGIAMFHERYGEDAPAQIAMRTEQAHQGIPITLAAVKRSAEGG